MIVKKNKKKIINKVFSFRSFILFGMLIVVILGANLGKIYYKEYQIQKEINSLQKEIKFLEKNNYNLSQVLEYYETDEYREAEVRKRFSLGKEGEKLAIITKIEDQEKFGEIKNEIKNRKISNYLKWWNYFFATR